MNINLYLDDTGTKEKTDLKTDIFGYCGIAVISKYENDIVSVVNELKNKYFGTIEVELKSKWFRLSDEREKHYLSKFNITQEQFSMFSKELFDTLCKQQIQGLGSVVSKEGLARKYTKVVFDASPVAYELLLQRFANLLTQYNATCEQIICDDMSGKNKTGRDWKDLLIRQHKKLKEGKSPMYRTWTTRQGMNYSKIPDRIDFMDSKTNTLIQVADLFAYNIMRQGRDFRNFDLPNIYTGYGWIIKKMHRHPITKKITGSGAVFFPK